MMKRVLAAACACLLALPAWAGVQIREVTSPGGITAWLVEDHSIPFMALELRFRGGTSLDAPGKRGAINLMTALLEEGAGDLDARAAARPGCDWGAGTRRLPRRSCRACSAACLGTGDRAPARCGA